MEFLPKWLQSLLPLITQYGLKLIGGIVLWIVGGMLIGLAVRLFKQAVSTRLEATLVGYLETIIGVGLKIVLIVAILGYFGVNTTTFAALLAGAGLAIGTAWGGLLKNFAAGVFIMVLSPYKRGDFITAGGVTGTVTEIGLFTTTFNTPDNVHTIVGNDKVFGGNIQNFTKNPFRRVELTAQLDHSTDVEDAIRRLKEKVGKIPNIAKDQGVDVEILTFTLAGPVLAVRPYVHNDHYWPVYFATNKAISEVGGEGAYAIPTTHYGITK